MTPEEQLTIISKAWGRQNGYCFFPWIDGSASNREERIQSYHEGTAYRWPRDKNKILDHLRSHTNDDLYWCPSLFERPERKMEFAMDEHCLWADLDEVDPRGIDDYPPTIAWETSPGRFQGLWLFNGSLMGASWEGNENQRLTYHLEADKSGWDTTQLMRLPGAPNHKFEYWNGEKIVDGKLLWANGRRYLPDEFEDLPEVRGAGPVAAILEGEIDHVDRHEVWGRVRLRVSSRVRDFVSAREATGDRSEVLWEIERELADAGCTVVEIVAVTRATVWNKYSGRQDELRRLTIEAAKAVELREDKPKRDGDSLEGSGLEDKPELQNLFDLVENIKPPEWIVKEILAAGACGMIAGEPKSFKSWIALDLILSIATGKPFLDHFDVRMPGPVIYVQEEDSKPMVKSRLSKVWPSKIADKVKIDPESGVVEWHPPNESDKPPVMAIVREGVILSDPGWQAWLDEKIAEGYSAQTEGGANEPYRMVLVDTLMSTAGEVDENRSVEMNNKIFKPLRVLAEKHGVAIVIIHHMKKAGGDTNMRGGLRMLGSQAGFAFVEDGLYIRHHKGDLLVEREGKNAVSGSFRITGIRRKGWTPAVTDDRTQSDVGDGSTTGEPAERPEEPDRPKRASPPKTTAATRRRLYDALKKFPNQSATSSEIARLLGQTPSSVHKSMTRLMAGGHVTKEGARWVKVPK